MDLCFHGSHYERAGSLPLSPPLFQLAADYKALFHHYSNNERGLRGQRIFVSVFHLVKMDNTLLL